MDIKFLQSFFHKTLSAMTIVTLAIAALPVSSVSAAPAFPVGFVSESVVTNLTGPTTIAFAPDGRMFIGQKDGRVRVFQNGILLPTDFINISSQVNNNWDRGLLGLAIHPDFPNTPYIYLLYTYDPPGTTDNGGGARVSRLLRVSADPNNTNVALPGSEVVLLGTNSTFANIGDPNGNDGAPSCQTGNVYVQNCIAADSPSHTIGTLVFGTDGSLFVSSGDGAHFNYTDARALRSLDVNSLNGKILRINPITGQGYANNPFYNGNLNSNRSKVYSLGLRNPFRTTINTLTNELFIGDVGWGTWEEINTGRGQNFGWPCYEGNNVGSAQQGSYANNAATSATCAALYAQGLGAVKAPTYAYNHNGGGASVQAGSFYRGNVYPAQYQGALFISDYNIDWMRYLTFDVNGNATVNDFGTDVAPVGGIVQLLSGPDTNLYYVAYNGPIPNTSEIRRIRYVAGGNTPPTANASANPTSGYVPLVVDFSSLGSFDPDAQPLTYLWNFGDSGTSTDPNPTHTYLASGNYTARLTVTDSVGQSGIDTVAITIGNLAPVATIITPTNGLAYNTGATINYSGTGIDNEDGNLSGASLQWDVLLHHNTHTHFDYIPGLTGISGSFKVPDHGDDTWIELCLTVTDSGGLNDQKCVNLTPNTVTLTFNTVPNGLNLEYDGSTYTAPFSVVTNVNAKRDLIASQTQGCYNFSSWSDGGAASHQITIGANPQTFTATYLRCPVTVTVNPGQSKFYGGADPVFTYTSSNPAAPFTGALSRTTGENAGSYPINQGTLAVADSTRFAITSFVPANFTINPKAASVTPNSASKTFGDVDPALTGTLTGFLPADNVTAAYSRTPGENAGSPYTISAVLSPAGVLSNYNITYNTANFTIMQINSLITLGNLNFMYDDTPKPTTATTNPPNLPVSITYNGSATAPTDAGSYSVVATITDPNYSGTASGTLVIARATVSPSITAGNKVYDGTAAATITGRTLNGVIGTDDVSLTGGTANFTNANTGTWSVTATGLTLSGADAGNYKLFSTSANTSATITRAAVTVTSTIHNASHAPIPSAANGDVIHDSATVTGIGATPTGSVTFKVFTNLSCFGPGSGAGIIPLDAGGVADPSNTTKVTGGDLSFQAAYNGDANYASQTGPCETLNVQPAFTSADNATFNIGSAGSFTVITTGTPTVSSISMSGTLPAGVTFTDNADGTATLAGIPDLGTINVYNLTFTATNGILPDATLEFTLTVDQALPPTINGINTIASTPDNILSEFEVVSVGVNQFTVTFNQDVISVGSKDLINYSDSAINPDNYMLVRDNGNNFETVSCAEGPGGDDTPISIESVEYNDNNEAGPFVATLSVNGGFPLSNGHYRLYVCGTTSITNQFGVALAGNGDPGTDFIRNFRVLFPGGDGGSNTRGERDGTKQSLASGLSIPVTGFAPDQATKLFTQPKDKAYAPTNGLRLDIPILSLNMPIVGVNLKGNSWDVTWLGNNAGYLEGSAYPTLSGNSIITGHVTDANGKPGPFAFIKELQIGDKVYIHNNGLIYVYEVRQSKLILPGSIKTLFKHEDYEWLTLVTCETYNAKLDKFMYRRMVRAVLISVIPEK